MKRLGFAVLLFLLPAAASWAAVPRVSNRAAALAFHVMQLRDEHGVIAPDGYLRAVAQRKLLIRAPQAASQGAPLQPMAGISSSQWSALGPGNIGGRVTSIAINPLNSNKMWAGTPDGGLWTTSDGGASWAAVNDFLPNLAISSVVIDPANTSIMYAATGDYFDNPGNDQSSYNGINGSGIFKSQDGGITWTQLSATDPALDAGWTSIYRMAIDPANPSILLAGTTAGCYRSADGGTTWTKVSTVATEDIEFDPNNPNNVIRGRTDGMVSYSRDAGATWSIGTVASGGGRVEIAYAKNFPNMVYASVDINSGSIYKSTNGGATWTLVSNPAHLQTQGWYGNVIWVDPVNSNHIVTGGIDLYASTDGGTTFVKVSDWTLSPTSPHADHHVLVADPGYDGVTDKKLYDGNDGGIYVAANIAAVNSNATNNGWTDLDNGLAITQFYNGSAGPNGKLTGGAQDNGSLVYSGSGSNWTSFFGGDGGVTAIDSVDSNYLYGEYTNLEPVRSTDGGVSAFDICQGIGDANAQDCGGTGQANFIAPYVLDPNNNNRMLAGGASLWVSNNVKAAVPSWSSIKPPTAAASNYISAVAVASGNSSSIWVGYNDGEIYYTANGTAASPSWTLVSSALPARMVTRIYVDPANSSLVYATFGGYAAGNVWKSQDNGATWTNIGGSLPQAPVYVLTRDPQNASWLYVGTDVGVFTSEDGGSTWFTTNDGPANVAVDDLFWMNGTTLVAATYGRGMFETAVSAVVTPQTGWWWDPNDSGMGFTIEKNATSGRLFMAGYLYDSTGRASWYAAGAALMTGSTFTAPLIEYSGGQTLTGAYQAPTGNASVGNVSITFTDSSHGTLTWPGGTIPIQRFDIVTGGAASAQPTGTPEAGWWWDSAQGGRGFSIEIQNGTLFMAGYMYDASGNPIWYASGPAKMLDATTYQGTWQQYGNGITLTGSYKPSAVVNSNVGTITLTFTSTTAATLTLPDGSQIPLIRYRF